MRITAWADPIRRAAGHKTDWHDSWSPARGFRAGRAAGASYRPQRSLLEKSDGCGSETTAVHCAADSYVGGDCLAQPAPDAAALPAAQAAPALNTGDTAWTLTSTALVLIMTVPGLALFYSGMVRKMNVLATVMQSFAMIASSRCCGWWSERGLAFALHGEAVP